MHFGYILKTLRISAGISLRELSRTIDVSPTYLSLVENGKQSSPSASRITQIEEALSVPPGYLQAMSNGVTTDLRLFLRQVPEVADFLDAAKENAMSPSDFMDLTGFLSLHGRKGLKEALKKTGFRSSKPAWNSMENTVINPYLWSFLDEKLIFDVSGIGGKEAFLEEVACRIANQFDEGLEADAILAELLKRENIASTGIGNGIAFPHACLPNLNRVILALIRIRDGLVFDAVDGKPVFVVMLLLGPCSLENVHLKLLARMAKLLSDNGFYRSVLDTKDHRDVISLFKSAEMKIPLDNSELRKNELNISTKG